ncbi:hypothetical protein PINS_up006242 [Pythium insidiosum]|nr:hypothetical protein PINS_up006242 [Pythium insidiosum]
MRQRTNADAALAATGERRVVDVSLGVGDWLDVMDAEGTWNVAQVLSIPSASEVEVKYDGWGDEYNEVVRLNSDRVAPYHTYTWSVKCWAKYKNWPWWPAIATIRPPGNDAGSAHLKQESRLFVDFMDRKDITKRCRCWVESSKVTPFDERFGDRRRRTTGSDFESSLALVLQSTASVKFPKFARGTLPAQFRNAIADPLSKMKKSMGVTMWAEGFGTNRERHQRVYVYADPDEIDAGLGKDGFDEDETVVEEIIVEDEDDHQVKKKRKGSRQSSRSNDSTSDSEKQLSTFPEPKKEVKDDPEPPIIERKTRSSKREESAISSTNSNRLTKRPRSNSMLEDFEKVLMPVGEDSALDQLAQDGGSIPSSIHNRGISTTSSARRVGARKSANSSKSAGASPVPAQESKVLWLGREDAVGGSDATDKMRTRSSRVALKVQRETTNRKEKKGGSANRNAVGFDISDRESLSDYDDDAGLTTTEENSENQLLATSSSVSSMHLGITHDCGDSASKAAQDTEPTPRLFVQATTDSPTSSKTGTKLQANDENDISSPDRISSMPPARVTLSNQRRSTRPKSLMDQRVEAALKAVHEDDVKEHPVSAKGKRSVKIPAKPNILSHRSSKSSVGQENADVLHQPDPTSSATSQIPVAQQCADVVNRRRSTMSASKSGLPIFSKLGGGTPIWVKPAPKVDPEAVPVPSGLFPKEFSGSMRPFCSSDGFAISSWFKQSYLRNPDQL